MPIADVAKKKKIVIIMDFVFIMLHVDLSGRDKMNVIFLYMKVIELFRSSSVSYIICTSLFRNFLVVFSVF